MFVGPVSRTRFIQDENWKNVIESAFDFSQSGVVSISDVSAVLAAVGGNPGEKDWMAIVNIKNFWWFVVAGYPKESSWAEGIGMAVRLSSDMNLSIASPLLPNYAKIRFAPQLLRLHVEKKIDITFFSRDVLSVAEKGNIPGAVGLLRSGK